MGSIKTFLKQSVRLFMTIILLLPMLAACKDHLGNPNEIAGGAFAEGTKIAIAEGFKNIQDFIVGDEILGCDTDLKWQPYTVQFINSVSGTFRIAFYISCDIDGEEGEIITSSNLTFLLHDGKFKRAQNLVPGDELMGADGSAVPVRIVSVGYYKGQMYAIATSVEADGGHLLNVNGVVCADFAYPVEPSGSEFEE